MQHSSNLVHNNCKTAAAVQVSVCLCLCVRDHSDLPVSPITSAYTYIPHPLGFQFIPVGSPLRGRDVVVYVKDINQLSLPTPFYSVLVSTSVYDPFNCIPFHKFS